MVVVMKRKRNEMRGSGEEADRSLCHRCFSTTYLSRGQTVVRQNKVTADRTTSLVYLNYSERKQH